MKTSNIFIPKRINVGFNERKDTYTGKLAYIIYWDEKGKLRKEVSWEGWRNKDIPAEAYDNEPTSGFVLNKNVGGYAYHWDARKAYIRIYDPRGFEFEITLPNLLYILENTNCIKGKGLEGEFVYGWDGKDLVLVPVAAPEYQAMQALTTMVFDTKPLGPKDLKVGYTYVTSKGDRYVYMGKAPKYTYTSSYVSSSYLYGRRNTASEILRDYPDAKRDHSSYYERYVAVIKKKPHFWFVKLQNGNAYIESFASFPRKFYTCEDDKPHSDYHIFEESLNSYSDYVPIDYTNYKHIPKDVNEFREKLQKQMETNINRGYDSSEYYNTLVDGVNRYCRIKLCGKDQTYTVYIADSTGDTHNYISKEVLTVDRICAKYVPIETTLYLQNGKEYKTRWSRIDGYKE